MNFRKLSISVGTALTTLGLLAAPVLAAVGNQNPNLTVQLTISPTVVTEGSQVTAIANITNNTKKSDKVVAELEITSPSGVTQSYYQKYTIGPGKTVSQTISYTVPTGAEKGIYTITLSATDKAGTSYSTEYVTVE